ncbi:hypothetical protein ALC60_09313 [Trachymyrmex zeteki]|uniref:Uncharacterized protein n=1 Tax=Mycetomoellerius zeteki TaxID=64791 RepID=A0A151WUV7_9HYME|nr:hypothetical protein ALC60_09313 [Trachymyrmex zeteki]
MHSLAMACVGLVPRPMPEPGLENAGVVGRTGARISGTMPRRRARTGNSYSPLRVAISWHRLRLRVEHDEPRGTFIILASLPRKGNYRFSITRSLEHDIETQLAKARDRDAQNIQCR